YLYFSSRRRHTRSKRDWSSDVCSSDLPYATSSTVNPTPETGPPLFTTSKSDDTPSTTADLHPCPAENGTGPAVHVTCGRVARAKIGRASCRERQEESWENGRGENKHRE